MGNATFRPSKEMIFEGPGEYGTPIRQRNIVLQWSEVKDQVRSVVEHGKPWPSQPSGAKLMPLHENPYKKEEWGRELQLNDDGTPKFEWVYDNFTRRRSKRPLYKPELLASGAQMLDWFRNGFRADTFRNSAEQVPAALQSRASWSEEDGDVDIGRLVGGHDDFLLGMAERPTKPGIHLQIEMAFACGVRQSVIEEYGSWVAGLIGAMEEYGFDMVVDLWIPLDDLFQDDRQVKRTNVLIRVKQANEVADFTEWSILFSPAGYRQIGFAAKCVAGDKIGKTVSYSYGMTIGGKTWGLEYDKETATVRITVNQRAGGRESFPGEKLTAAAIAADLIPDPEKAI